MVVAVVPAKLSLQLHDDKIKVRKYYYLEK